MTGTVVDSAEQAPRRGLARLAGTIPAGTKGICGDPAACAIAQHLKDTYGAVRPRIGLETMSFTIGDVRYTVPTPLDLRRLQYRLDKSGPSGSVEQTDTDVNYSIRLATRRTKQRPVQRMTVEEKDRLAERRALRGPVPSKSPEKIREYEARRQAKEKGRLS